MCGGGASVSSLISPQRTIFARSLTDGSAAFRIAAARPPAVKPSPLGRVTDTPIRSARSALSNVSIPSGRTTVGTPAHRALAVVPAPPW